MGWLLRHGFGHAWRPGGWEGDEEVTREDAEWGKCCWGVYSIAIAYSSGCCCCALMMMMMVMIVRVMTVTVTKEEEVVVVVAHLSGDRYIGRPAALGIKLPDVDVAAGAAAHKQRPLRVGGKGTRGDLVGDVRGERGP